jgi:N-acetylmuramoyl-L-alanine amidase CwlA
MTDKQPYWWPIVGEGFLPDNFAEYISTVDMCEFESRLGAWKPQFVVLHNTAVPTFKQWHDISGRDRMNNLEHYYRDELRWTAGPHLFIADDLIWVFTPINVRGIHSPSWNHTSWGVELVGDYEKEELLPIVKSNAITAIAALCQKCNLAADTLRLHHEDPLTTHKGCPGKNVIKQEFINGIQLKMKQQTQQRSTEE